MIHPENLEKRIDALPGVCDDVKKAIKQLFTDGFGIEFPRKDLPVKFISGGVYSPVSDKNFCYWLVCTTSCHTSKITERWVLRNLRNGISAWKQIDELSTEAMQDHLNREFVHVADSLEDYYCND